MAEVNLDVAMQSTSEEILEKLDEGVKVSGEVTIKETAQTKEFTQTVVGNVGTVETTITGNGLITIMQTTGWSEPVLIIDGATVVNGTQFRADQNNCPTQLSLYFSKSISVQVKDSNGELIYIIQT